MISFGSWVLQLVLSAEILSWPGVVSSFNHHQISSIDSQLPWYTCLILMVFVTHNARKQGHKSSPCHHSVYRCYVYPSQSWVVSDIVLPTLFGVSVKSCTPEIAQLPSMLNDDLHLGPGTCRTNRIRSCPLYRGPKYSHLIGRCDVAKMIRKTNIGILPSVSDSLDVNIYLQFGR